VEPGKAIFLVLKAEAAGKMPVTGSKFRPAVPERPRSVMESGFLFAMRESSISSRIDSMRAITQSLPYVSSGG